MALGKACIVSETVSLSAKWGEDSWLWLCPRIPGASKGGHPWDVQRNTALTLHLSTRIQIPSLLFPAWAMWPNGLTSLGLICSSKNGINICISLMVPLWTVNEDNGHSAWYRASVSGSCSLGVNRMHLNKPGGFPVQLCGTPRCQWWHAALLSSPWNQPQLAQPVISYL